MTEEITLCYIYGKPLEGKPERIECLILRDSEFAMQCLHLTARRKWGISLTEPVGFIRKDGSYLENFKVVRNNEHLKVRFDGYDPNFDIFKIHRSRSMN